MGGIDLKHDIMTLTPFTRSLAVWSQTYGVSEGLFSMLRGHDDLIKFWRQWKQTCCPVKSLRENEKLLAVTFTPGSKTNLQSVWPTDVYQHDAPKCEKRIARIKMFG